MGIFDTIFKSTVQTVAYDPDCMPGLELVTYTPWGGTPKSIYVSVIRQGPQNNYPGGKSIGEAIGVRIANHATKGVSAINTRDTITIARLPGETPAAKIIDQIGPESNASEWVVIFK